jgi:hypothetical protein
LSADFDMQPLSRVKSDAITNWGDPPMAVRPALAVKVAHCIAQWSEIEVLLGAFLALLLHANERAALAMYSGLENRSAQLRLILAAAEASLPDQHFRVISALLSALVRPAMRERDRLAHWMWGFSEQLPDALLIARPSYNLKSLMEALRRQRGDRSSLDVPSSFDEIFVVRDADLERIEARGLALKNHLRSAMATVWELNTAQQRVSNLQQLSNVAEIRAALDRQGDT